MLFRESRDGPGGGASQGAEPFPTPAEGGIAAAIPPDNRAAGGNGVDGVRGVAIYRP